MKRLQRKLTYANVISTLCLFLLLGGGSAYAATQLLPKASVGAKQLKNGSVTPAKLSVAAKSTLTGPAGKQGATGPKGAEGPRGLEGKQGIEGRQGIEGPRGPSDLYTEASETMTLNPGISRSPVESLSLPAGSYLVIAGQTAVPYMGAGELDCWIYADGVQEASFFGKSPEHGSNVVVGQAVITLTSPTTVSDECQAFEHQISLADPRITAVAVGAVH
jgi:Collagen triple helix repeat (20 copies)